MVEQLQQLVQALQGLRSSDHLVQREIDAARGHIKTALLHIEQKQKMFAALKK